MGYATSIGKYHLGRTIGEGTIAKVKLAVNTETNKNVAIKIIDKKMVLQNKLMHQVNREISTMKLLRHPNIVKIYEVIATKMKIYLVMEYVSGGKLSDKLLYLKSLDETEARKYFQQLIDAVDYCYGRGVYHRDLKHVEKGEDRSLVSNRPVYVDFVHVGYMDAFSRETCYQLPVDQSYVAPEVIVHKHYEGASTDVWSCGVILFELFAGYLPFEDCSLVNLYRKISRAEYICPEWFAAPERKLISRILDPLPTKRVMIAEILEDEWFRVDYEPSAGNQNDETLNSGDLSNAVDSKDERTNLTLKGKTQRFISAFQLIAMSNDLDLSGLFHEQKTKLGSRHSIDETPEKIKVAAKGVSLSVERMDNSKLKLHYNKSLARSRSHFTPSAEVFEVTPIHCVVEISKSSSNLRAYGEFCKSLSSLLGENSAGRSSELKAAKVDKKDGKEKIPESMKQQYGWGKQKPDSYIPQSPAPSSM